MNLIVIGTDIKIKWSVVAYNGVFREGYFECRTFVFYL
jgi:hypothetical protein